MLGIYYYYVLLVVINYSLYSTCESIMTTTQVGLNAAIESRKRSYVLKKLLFINYTRTLLVSDISKANKQAMIYAVTSSTFKQFLKNGDSTKLSAKEFA